MSSVNTNDLRVKNANNLIKSFNGPGNQANAYMFIGRARQWETDRAAPVVPVTNSGDAKPPLPKNNVEDFYTTWDNMLSLKRIKDGDAFHMLPRVNWNSGVVYDMYRHDYSDTNRSHSNASNLYDARFYIINTNNEVFVCLDNNRGSQSLVEPLNPGQYPFTTSDGYQWLYLFNVSQYMMTNYSTNNYIPITADNVNYVNPGEIHTVVVDDMGEGYTTSPTGYSNQVPYYFCKIVGDGRGAVARVYVSDGRIRKVKVERHGIGYKKASLDFRPNHVYTSLVDLDLEMNGVNPLGDGTFRSTVIISPPYGWGASSQLLRQSRGVVDPVQYRIALDDAKYKLARQLGGTRVCVFSNLKYNQEDFISNTTFRQVGILSDPDGHVRTNDLGDPVYPETLTACKAVILDEPLPGENDEYYVGEEISQIREDGNKAKGLVVGYKKLETGECILRYVQDPEIHSDDVGNMYIFKGEELIIGDTSNVESKPLVDVGIPNPYEVDSLTFVGGFNVPEIMRYSGTFTYVTNLSPVQRSTNQSERVSLLIAY